MRNGRYILICLVAGLVMAADGGARAEAETAPAVTCDINPGPGNPRNSEGAFVLLKDGRLLFVYSHFTGSADDAGAAYLAGRYSSDGGRSWTPEDVTVLPNEGTQNTMSVSLLRLKDGRVALFYLRKNSDADCRPYVRFSVDEAQTWSSPTLCADSMGYFVVNNDRVIQLSSGRLVMPAARHSEPGKDFRARGQALCFLSDDAGASWRASKSQLEAPEASRSGLQEPGVVELADGRLLMLIRTDQGCQMRSLSVDGGDSWSEAEKTGLRSPVSPASFKRLPGSNDLLVVWNDHRNSERKVDNRRTPLTVALSSDNGSTWSNARNLESAPDGWYCYTAITFVEDAALLGYCAGDTVVGGLNRLRISRVPLAWLKHAE